MARLLLVVLLAFTIWRPTVSVAGAPPRLGGAAADFLVLGPRTDRDRGADSMQYLLGGCPDGSAKWAIENIEGKVSSIVRYSCGNRKMSRQTARDEARGFFPVDAESRGRFTAGDGSQADMFFSVSLSKVFPRTLFRGMNNKQIAAGTFSFVSDADGTMWALAIGANP